MDLADLHHETKFLLPAARAPLALAVLSSACRPDGEHPVSEVVSIYFDTPDLASYREKRASEYRKTKWRLRWYRVGGKTAEPAFVERKDRIGTRRRKQRTAAPLPAATLDALPFCALRASELFAPLARAGELAPLALRPCVRLEYLRRRFVEPTRRDRIAFDSAIRAAAAPFERGLVRDPRALPWAVLEVKGVSAGLPRLLESLAALGARRGSFSKYAAILEQQGLAAGWAA